MRNEKWIMDYETIEYERISFSDVEGRRSMSQTESVNIIKLLAIKVIQFEINGQCSELSRACGMLYMKYFFE